jgi:hypothetical protein
METVRQSLAALPAIRKGVQTVASLDDAENTIRQILENNMVRIVGAFQRAAEGLFDRLPKWGEHFAQKERLSESCRRINCGVKRLGRDTTIC